MRLRPFLFTVLAALLAAPAHAQGPTLVPAALRNITPAGVRRGEAVAFTLDGLNLKGATRAIFDDPAITGTPEPGANANQVKVRATVGVGTRPGVHRVYLATPLGVTGAVTFAVGAWPELRETEPNEAPGSGPLIPLPATLVGAMGQAGDVDCFRFQCEQGQELVFQVLAAPLRSRFQSVLTLLGPGGDVVAEAQGGIGTPDARLFYMVPQTGRYTLRVRDWESAAGSDVNYRINVGEFVYSLETFPLGLKKGSEEITLFGTNTGGLQTVRVSSDAAGWGATTLVTETAKGPLLEPVRLAVGEEPERLEAHTPHANYATAQPLPVPVTVNGRIERSGREGDDYYRFRARKDQPLVLEVNARRLGSGLDSVLEVLDRNGNRVERATLRPVAETALTLSDRDSATPGLRLLAWNDMAVNDFLYVRGELLQLVALPRGPDDDARFRSFRGQRVGLLDTTPTGHALNTPIYKVQVHPPGRQFPPNGMPTFRLYYRNDDGGPLYGKDSRLMFTAPEDGEYVVRIADVRGQTSQSHGYRLTLREARPDFRLTAAPEHPGIPAGASIPLEVTADRLDDFAGPIQISLEGLPEGVTANTTTIEAGETTATLLLTAAPNARTAAPGPLRMVGRAVTPTGEITRTGQLADGAAIVTILPRADLTVRTAQQKITLRPGTEQYIEAAITRENGFAGRVPIDLRNLPYGVRILDVGLNGVLITEGETTRRFTIVCEPWVQPQRRTLYCTVRTETASPAPTEVGTPVELEITK